MAAGPLPQVVIACKIGIRAAHRLRHRGLALRHGDEVNVIRHQAISPNRQTLPLTVVSEQVQIQDVVSILKEDLLPSVPALCNVIGNAFQNDAGYS